jgi:hypothetical protein
VPARLIEWAFLTNTDRLGEVKSAELQTEINQLARNLGVRPISVGFPNS